MSSPQSPGAKLEARANREHAKLAKTRDELQLIHATIKHSDLPSEVKLRLYGAIRQESDLLAADAQRIDGLRQAAQLSRSKQWVTSGDE